MWTSECVDQSLRSSVPHLRQKHRSQGLDLVDLWPKGVHEPMQRGHKTSKPPVPDCNRVHQTMLSVGDEALGATVNLSSPEDEAQQI